MKTAARFATLLFSLSTGLPAQHSAAGPAPVTPPSSPPNTVVQWKTSGGAVAYAPLATACPLAMQVKQGTGGALRAAKNDETRTEASATRLYMTLRDTRPDTTLQRMVKATVTVSGINGRDHVMGLDERSDRAYQISRTFTVRLDEGIESGATAELRLPGFAATTWVELKSVTYSDGQVLTFASPAGCRVAPDPLMLVSPR